MHFLDTPCPKNHAQTHAICIPAIEMAMLLQIYIMCIVNKGIASLIQKVLNNKNKNMNNNWAMLNYYAARLVVKKSIELSIQIKNGCIAVASAFQPADIQILEFFDQF